jgi:hypothetical protein
MRASEAEMPGEATLATGDYRHATFRATKFYWAFFLSESQ